VHLDSLTAPYPDACAVIDEKAVFGRGLHTAAPTASPAAAASAIAAEHNLFNTDINFLPIRQSHVNVNFYTLIITQIYHIVKCFFQKILRMKTHFCRKSARKFRCVRNIIGIAVIIAMITKYS
jgi:hypothetical protein